jgi:DNA-binding ferritin-like protein
MDKCCKIAALYIAILKAITLIHKDNHWLTQGNDFYGKHLLFERLYDSAVEDLDLAAEKFIGLLGSECLNYELQYKFLNSALLKYKNASQTPEQCSLKIEKDFIKFSEECYKCFEEHGALTFGLDDMMMSIVSKREESIYLLQQMLKK